MTTATTEAPKIGVHKNVPAEDYHAWPALSASVLKQFRRSPAHAKWYMDHKHEMDSPALEMGRAYHDAILLPNEFANQWVKAPKFDHRTKQGKEDEAAFIASLNGKNALDPDSYDECIAMRDAVLAHPVAKELLTGPGHNEISIVAKDPETGLVLKARLDRYASYKGISTHMDVKGTVDASPFGFQRDAAKYGYHVQMGLYQHICNILAPAMRRIVFIAVEKNAPYSIGVYEVAADQLENCVALARKLLGEYATCVKNNYWPDYTPKGIEQLVFPEYAFNHAGMLPVEVSE